MYEKLASQVPAILADTARTLRSLGEDNVKLAEERDAAITELRLWKIARRMEERGIDDNLSFDEKLAALRSERSDKLDTLEAAIELTPGGFKLGSLREDKGSGSNTSGDDLEAFLLSGQALGG